MSYWHGWVYTDVQTPVPLIHNPSPSNTEGLYEMLRDVTKYQYFEQLIHSYHKMFLGFVNVLLFTIDSVVLC